MSRSTQRPARLTTTSYAILGLLAVRPWSTYELATQMDRSVGRYWPRARSKLYEEPEEARRPGARGRREPVRRTSPAHRLPHHRRGAARPGRLAPRSRPGPRARVRAAAEARLRGERHEGRRPGPADRRPGLGLRTEPGEPRGGPRVRRWRRAFPARAAQNLLVGAFLTDFYAMVAHWAEWATPLVEAWPDSPGEATADRAALREVLTRAEWS